MSRKQNKSSSHLTPNPTELVTSFPFHFRSANDDEDFKSPKSYQQEAHKSSTSLASATISLPNLKPQIKPPKAKSQNASSRSRRTQKDLQKDHILLQISEFDRQGIINHRIGQIFESRDKKLEEDSAPYKLEEYNFEFGTTSSQALQRARDYKFPLWTASTQLNDLSTACCSNFNDFPEANDFSTSFIGNSTAEALEEFALAKAGNINHCEPEPDAIKFLPVVSDPCETNDEFSVNVYSIPNPSDETFKEYSNDSDIYVNETCRCPSSLLDQIGTQISDHELFGSQLFTPANGTPSTRLTCTRKNLSKVESPIKLLKAQSQNATAQSRTRTTQKDMSNTKNLNLLEISEFDRQLSDLSQKSCSNTNDLALAEANEFSDHFAISPVVSPKGSPGSEFLKLTPIKPREKRIYQKRSNKGIKSKIVSPKPEVLVEQTSNGIQSSLSKEPSHETLAQNDSQSTSTAKMLNYSLVETPILKDELKKYGLKPVGKPKAKLLLQRISGSKSDREQVHTSSTQLTCTTRSLIKIKLPMKKHPKVKSQNTSVKSGITQRDMSNDPNLLKVKEFDLQDMITHRIGQIFESGEKLDEAGVASNNKLEEYNFEFGTTLERERAHKSPLWRASTQLGDLSNISCNTNDALTEKNDFGDHLALSPVVSPMGSPGSELLKLTPIKPREKRVYQKKSKKRIKSKIILPKPKELVEQTSNGIPSLHSKEPSPERMTQNDFQPPSTTSTPMLNYSLIETPILKDELKKYGLKPVGRPKAKLLLRHIYGQTHK